MSAGGSNEPNLTPFIDLFSVMICFLLMTAAWLQLEALQTNVEVAPPKAEDAQADTTPTTTIPDLKKVKLTVEMFPDRVVLKENEKENIVPNQGGKFDSSQVKQLLTQWRTNFPDKKDIILNTDAQVKYGDLISMYDLMITADWPDVGISPK